jgi:hypothetical protein
MQENEISRREMSFLLSSGIGRNESSVKTAQKRKPQNLRSATVRFSAGGER